MKNPLTRTFLCFVLWLVISEEGSVTADECVQVDSCSCQFSDGRKIDLSPLSSNDVNSPRFFDVPVRPGSDDMFSWNPCADFLQPSSSSCQGVAVCHIHLAPPIAVYFNLGTTDTAVFSTNDNGQVVVSYRHIETGTPTTQRSSHIALMCDQSQEGGFVPLFESDPGSGQFQFELHSKYTCYANSADNDDDNVFSVGTIICLAALAVGLLYLVGGVSYNVFYKKSIGMERIPNVSVWRVLPGLIKDGFLFVFTRGRTSSTYRNI